MVCERRKHEDHASDDIPGIDDIQKRRSHTFRARTLPHLAPVRRVIVCPDEQDREEEHLPADDELVESDAEVVVADVLCGEEGALLREHGEDDALHELENDADFEGEEFE